MSEGDPGDPVSDVDPDPLPTSCPPPNADQGALCSGGDPKTDTSKRRRKREHFFHDESGADQKPDTFTRRRKRGKQVIAPISGSVTTHAHTPTVPKSTWFSYDESNPCLALFLELSEDRKQKVRRSVWQAKNKTVRTFKKVKVLSIRGDDLVWPCDPHEQTFMLALVTFNLYDLWANDSDACPFRRGAAMEFLNSTYLSPLSTPFERQQDLVI